MAQTLTLDLPTIVYDTLARTAQHTGRPVEEVATGWVEKAAIQSVDDPLLQLAGVLESDVEDIGSQHDRFLGTQWRETHD
ncbi:MAG TPA: hypothetical protein PK170_03410 [Anaerolineae bacterium]|nr:hypothetical protein [Anaerolineae bacterium]